jgi:adenylylsulfate kinase-like enzyme
MSNPIPVEHGPCVVWFTGLPSSGKTTIATLVQHKLTALGCRVFLLDGDSLRRGLSNDLGFSEIDRSENLRRAAEVAGLIAGHGFIVLAAFITPRKSDRASVRARLSGSGRMPGSAVSIDQPSPQHGGAEVADPCRYLEVFVDAPLAVAEARDAKGLYRRARQGEIEEFTGVGAAYEAPDAPDLRLDTTLHDADALAMAVVNALIARHVLPASRAAGARR